MVMKNILEIKQIFAERLQELMKDKGYNITQLSLAVQLPRTSINSWLNLKRIPQIDALCALAQFFGVTTDYLLGLEN